MMFEDRVYADDRQIGFAEHLLEPVKLWDRFGDASGAKRLEIVEENGPSAQGCKHDRFGRVEPFADGEFRGFNSCHDLHPSNGGRTARISIRPLASGCHAGQLYAGKVDGNVEGNVEVVGEEVESDMRHDLDDLPVVKAYISQLGDIVRRDMAPRIDNLDREGESRGRPRVGRAASLGFCHLLRCCAGLAAKARVCGEAIVAVVSVSNGDSDLFAELSVQATIAERTERTPHARQSGRRGGGRLKHVWHHAERRLDLGELFCGLTRCVGEVNKCNSRHVLSLY